MQAEVAMDTPVRQRGFSLIELMIAMTIGLVLLAAVAAIATNSSRTQRDIERMGSQVENGRYALDLLRREIEHAGYYGAFYDVGAPEDVPADPSTTDVNQITEDIGLPIQGYDDVSGDPVPSELGDDAHRDGTDILVLRRAATEATAVDALTAEELYVQGLSIDTVIAQAAGDSSSDESEFDLVDRNSNRVDIRKLRTDIYHVGPDADGIPTLKRLSLTEAGGSLGWRQEALATGVEQLQVQYGRDTDNDGVAETYGTAPGTVGGWADVVALRVYLLVRTREASPDYTDEKTYDIGQDNRYDPADDGYRRRVFSSVVRATNRGIRRE